MKLPFTRDAASLLQNEIAAEAAATAKLADMRGARAQALLDDDITVIEKHDADIAALERQISIHQDRILALDAKLHAEEAAERERRYLADVAAVEPGRVKTLRGITAPGILRLVVTLRAKKCKNSSSTQRYNQIRFRFHTA